MRRRGIAIGIVTGLVATWLTLVGGALPAYACSCIDMTIEAHLAEADAAVVGTVTAVGNAALTLEVERASEPEIGSSVMVGGVGPGPACGLDIEAGARVGLLLTDRGDRWSSSSCSRADPDRLLALLPAPDVAAPASGPGATPWVALLVVGVLVTAVLLVVGPRARRDRPTR